MTRRRKWAILAAASMLGVVAIGEAFARWGLGLGDPPLSVEHPTIEYLFKPGIYRRFGNLVAYNRHHMRSPEGDRFDVLVVGDSVVNGGSQTDQSELATTLLAERLGMSVANVSAGSWGPQNQLAYLREFGTFGAKVVVFVWGSGDAGDIPTFEPIVDHDPDFPGSSPPLALWEAATRYLPRYLNVGGATDNQQVPGAASPRTEALDAVTEAVELTRTNGAVPVVALYLERGESPDQLAPGHVAIRNRLGEAVHYVVIDLPDEAFRDRIHPNIAGQSAIADVLEPVIKDAFGQADAGPATPSP